ncbi:hypothetical protein KUCAC02_009413 [Chaenocephalus aceratus]|uniref:Uncharacterized protein n=1 Tax=Chaenocephalus aceratus TaxID=36190 RepID=A0ACB9WUY1_CHAAC|nr:hypothetical protein KUCAC02_009413 [Chaenocephalus aceratus]
MALSCRGESVHSELSPMNLQTLPVVLYLSSLRCCRDSGVLGSTRGVGIEATSPCPGIRPSVPHFLTHGSPITFHPLPPSPPKPSGTSVTRALGDATLPAAFLYTAGDPILFPLPLRLAGSSATRRVLAWTEAGPVCSEADELQARCGAAAGAELRRAAVMRYHHLLV